MHARRLRQPRVVLVLAVAVISFGVFSSSVGIGALPTSTLPVYGVTNGDRSRATVAELGDVNGDGIGDYALGLPNANGGSGMVYVFLGHVGALRRRRRRSTWTRPRSRSPATEARCSASPSPATTSTATA
jgi:hypothetical protein